MQITVQGRHWEVPEDLREFTVEKMSHLAKYMATIQSVDVEFVEDGKGHKSGIANLVQVTVHTSGPVFRSKANLPDPRAGVDQAFKRLERQVKEFKRMRSGKPAHSKAKEAGSLKGEGLAISDKASED